MAGLALMRFVDRKGPYAVMIYPLLSLPFLLVLGVGSLQGDAFIVLSLIGAVLSKAAITESQVSPACSIPARFVPMALDGLRRWAR